MKDLPTTEPGDIVDWRHDIAHSRRGVLNHRIMRYARFSLCGQVMHEEGLAYVGAWDDGVPCNCHSCNTIWKAMRMSAERSGVPV